MDAKRVVLSSTTPSYIFSSVLQVADSQVPFALNSLYALSAIDTSCGFDRDQGDKPLNYLLYKGRLGFLLDPLDSTAVFFDIPVNRSGHATNPKITICALDPDDLEGHLNRIPMTTLNATCNTRIRS